MAVDALAIRSDADDGPMPARKHPFRLNPNDAETKCDDDAELLSMAPLLVGTSPDEYTRRAQRDEARRNIIGRSTKTDESPRHPNRAASSTLGSLTSAAGRSAVQATPCLALALDKRCHRPVAVTVGIIARKFVGRIGSTSIRLISLRGNGVVVGLRRSDAATLARLVWVPRYASEARSPHQRG